MARDNGWVQLYYLTLVGWGAGTFTLHDRLLAVEVVLVTANGCGLDPMAHLRSQRIHSHLLGLSFFDYGGLGGRVLRLIRLMGYLKAITRAISGAFERSADAFGRA